MNRRSAASTSHSFPSTFFRLYLFNYNDSRVILIIMHSPATKNLSWKLFFSVNKAFEVENEKLLNFPLQFSFRWFRFRWKWGFKNKLLFCRQLNCTSEKVSREKYRRGFCKIFLKAQKRFQENLPLKRKYSGKVFAV